MELPGMRDGSGLKDAKKAAEYRAKLHESLGVIKAIEAGAGNVTELIAAGSNFTETERSRFNALAANAQRVTAAFADMDGKLTGKALMDHVRKYSADKSLLAEIKNKDQAVAMKTTHGIFLQLSDWDYSRVNVRSSTTVSMAHLNHNVVFMPPIGGERHEIPFGFTMSPQHLPHEDVHAAMHGAMGTDHVNPLPLLNGRQPIEAVSELYDYYLRKAGEEVLAGFVTDPTALSLAPGPVANDIVSKRGSYDFYSRFLSHFNEPERSAIENRFGTRRYDFQRHVGDSALVLDPVVSGLEKDGMSRPDIAKSLAYTLAFEPINKWGEITGNN